MKVQHRTTGPLRRKIDVGRSVGSSCSRLAEIGSDVCETANVAGFLPRQPSRPSLESIANLVQSGPSATIVKITPRGTSGANGTDRFFPELNCHATRNKKYVRDLG
jgi:hypothetical protein